MRKRPSLSLDWLQFENYCTRSGYSGSSVREESITILYRIECCTCSQAYLHVHLFLQLMRQQMTYRWWLQALCSFLGSRRIDEPKSKAMAIGQRVAFFQEACSQNDRPVLTTLRAEQKPTLPWLRMGAAEHYRSQLLRQEERIKRRNDIYVLQSCQRSSNNVNIAYNAKVALSDDKCAWLTNITAKIIQELR